MLKTFLLGISLLAILNVNAQNITKFEYFIDNDPGIGLATASSPTASPTITDFNIPISIASLSAGFHTVYIRAQNNAGDWTHTHFRTFYIVTPLAPPPTTITQMEYFVDIDPGVGLATQVPGITPSAVITNFPIDIAAASFTPGFHTLYVRSKTSGGNWTHTHFRNFYVTSLPVGDNLVTFEYFFDADPGFDNGIAAPVIPIAPSVTNQNILAVPSSLSMGLHTIFVRAKTSNGNWTQVASVTFSVTTAALPTISGFTPVSGPVGTFVTITGTNFTGTTSVTFGGTAATSFTIVSPMTITAIVNKSSSGVVSITNAVGAAASVALFTITVPATISIQSQPISAVVCEGGAATFTTSATGTTNITYQWQFSVTVAGVFADIANGGGYSNVTTSTLSIDTKGNFGAGFYRCKVGGDLAPAVLTDVSQLTINSIPGAPTTTGANFCTGSGAFLIASGGTNGNYRWYTAATGGVATGGQTGSTYATPVLSTTTIFYVTIVSGTCESLRTPVTATVSTNCTSKQPLITAVSLTTQGGGKIVFDLKTVITTANNNLDLTSLSIIGFPPSGAVAAVDANGILTVDYSGMTFTGVEQITIQACDTDKNCVQQSFSLEIGVIIVYNAVSPNGKNPSFLIENINNLPDTKANSVYIFDRWENQVWHGINYDNTTIVFDGVSNDGSDLPPGVYYYKIIFTSGRKTQSGFISLRR